MSKSTIRKDKTCLNCRHVVEKRFCPNCGQENSDSRKTFHQLFVHFFEDLTHYENAFWKTIRNLILKPGSLTTEYLSGRRLSYLAPVRLYIFISFVTFFILSAIYKPEWPDDVRGKLALTKTDSTKIARMNRLVESGVLSREDADNAISLIKKRSDNKISTREQFGLQSIEELDEEYQNQTGEEAISNWEYKLERKILEITDKYSGAEMAKKFMEELMHNFPKALFIYMPIFAFFLWLFHDKRKWYYFDHGIFTLHYFSFLLLFALLKGIISTLLDSCGNSLFVSFFNGALMIVGTIWMFYYFFPAHHRFYGESRGISFIKSIALLFINFFFGSFVMLGLILYSIYSIH
jgi:hypothetical protein